MPKIEDLEKFVELSPDDPFPRYGLAMQLRGDGRLDEAVATFAELVRRFPGYVPGHHQYGASLAAAGRTDDARAAWTAGIEAARKAGDAHAASEMEGALAELR